VDNGILTFALALATSWSLTLPVREFALWIGMVDHPGPRKVHRTPIPLLGGLAIYCAAILATLLSLHGQARTQVLGILGGATLLLVVGILDDRGLLHHQVKLLLAMPLAAVILIASGVRAQIAFNFLPPQIGLALNVGITLVWVVGVTAAFSILDHMDGLCSGIAGIAAFFFAVLAVRDKQVLVGTLGAALFGAALGFLRWNFTPARIFMGDGGAMFLGFMMATLGLKLRLSTPDSAAWIIPVMVLGVPIFDTSLVWISRSRRGLVPFTSPGKDHSAHRLANTALGQRRAVLVMYAAGVLSGSLALFVTHLTAHTAYVLLVVLITMAVAAVIALERFPYQRQATKRSNPVPPVSTT